MQNNDVRNKDFFAKMVRFAIPTFFTAWKFVCVVFLIIILKGTHMPSKITSFFKKSPPSRVKENIAPTPIFDEQTLDGFPIAPPESDIESVGSLPRKQNSIESISDATGADPLFKREEISTSSSALDLEDKHESASNTESSQLIPLSQQSEVSSSEEAFENPSLTIEQVASVLNLTPPDEQKIAESELQIIIGTQSTQESNSVVPTVEPVLSTAILPLANTQQMSLTNIESVIDWIVKHKAFLVASFSGDLDKWVNEKLKIQDPLFLSLMDKLDSFNAEFSNCMKDKSTVDVRKLTAEAASKHNQFPSAQACFIDAVNGLTGYIKDDSYEIGERNSVQILPNINNSLLREFLNKNELVALCLQTKLMSLTKITQLWEKDQPIAMDEVINKPIVMTTFNYRKKLTDDKNVPNIISLPPDRFLGTAVRNGECFLDSIAQHINASLETTREVAANADATAQNKELSLSNHSYSVKYLRLLCHHYVHNKSPDWVRPLISHGQRIEIDYRAYLDNITSTAEEFEAGIQEKRLPDTAVWGVPEIEGRILCDLFKIQLHIIELYENDDNTYSIDEKIVNKDVAYITQKFKPEDYDKDDNMIHLVSYKNHIVPIWSPNAPNNGLVKINPELLEANLTLDTADVAYTPMSKKRKQSPLILPDNKLPAAQAASSLSSLLRDVSQNTLVEPGKRDDKAATALAAGSMNSLLSRVKSRTDKLSQPGNPDRLNNLGTPMNPASLAQQNNDNSSESSPRSGTKRSAVVIY